MTRRAEATPRSAKRSLRDRTLAHYPPPRTRMTCLGIVVLATVVLYYQFFLIGAVSTRVMAEFHLSFTAYGVITVGAAVAGAVASLLAGIADRYGRANIITIGLAIVDCCAWPASRTCTVRPASPSCGWPSGSSRA